MKRSNHSIASLDMRPSKRSAWARRSSQTSPAPNLALLLTAAPLRRPAIRASPRGRCAERCLVAPSSEMVRPAVVQLPAARLDVKSGLELAYHHADERVAAVGLVFQTAQNHLLQADRHVRIELARHDKLGAVELFGQNLARRIAGERFLVGEQLKRADTIGEDIDARRDRLTEQLLGRHVG